MVTLPSENIKMTFPDPLPGQTHWSVVALVPTFTTLPDTRTWGQKQLHRVFRRLGYVFERWMYRSFDIADNWAKPGAVQTGSRHIKVSTVKITEGE